MLKAHRALLALTQFCILGCTVTPALAQIGPSINEAPPLAKVEHSRQVTQQPTAESQPQTELTTDSALESSTQQENNSATNSGSKPLGLPRQSSESQPIGTSTPTTPLVLGKEFVRTVATLAGVLMLIFALAHIYKRIARTRGGLSGQIGAGGRAPAGLVEVLGRYPISSGMTLVVLRFDRKVLLLSHAGRSRGKKGLAGVGGMQTLCEVSSAEEVASILAKTRDASGESIAASFERTLQEAGSATDQEIAKAMYQPAPGMHVQRPRRVAPGLVSNDEGDRLELTSQHESPAATQVMRRRLGAMRRGL
ncbi:MAG: hypothetical protein JJ974_11880 [Phycisphaerales bacterium]|nr:hypothetical protein [Phycisphaerales bacterium]